MTTERVFDVIRDPQILERERADKHLRDSCVRIHDIVDEMDRETTWFDGTDTYITTGNKISDCLHEIKDTLIRVCDELDKHREQQDD